MKNEKTITVLVILIAAASIVATSFGMFANGGSGQYEYKTICGQKIMIYDKGYYCKIFLAIENPISSANKN